MTAPIWSEDGCACAGLSQTPAARRQRRQTLARRLEAVKAYGGACACCDEDRLVMLTIDHVHGGGTQHRLNLATVRVDGRGSSQELYRAVREAGYPKGQYQILCYNCQAAKGPTGICPCRTSPTVAEVDHLVTSGEHLPFGHDVSAAGLRCMANERRTDVVGECRRSTE